MRATSGEGFAAALGGGGGACPQGGQDDDVRNYQGNKGQNGQHPGGGNDHKNQQAGVSAGQLQQGEYITEIVVYLIGATEGKLDNNQHLQD